MLTILLVIWLRRTGADQKIKNTYRQFFALLNPGRKVILLTLLLPITSMGQFASYTYHVLRNNEKIGTIIVNETTGPQERNIRLQSDIKTRMLFPIRVSTIETTVMDGERIRSSESIRKVNGNKEVTRSLQFTGNGYQATGNSTAMKLQNTILYNTTVSLYVAEPGRSLLVFSDTYNKVLPLRNDGNHQYTLLMPDGNVNIYKYHNGVCEEVMLDHTFFTARIVLVKIVKQ